MLIDVFVENEAGNNTKNHYDEKSLTWRGSVQVSRPYPFPYGFILGTTGADGDNVDCFVITTAALSRGQRLVCRPVALMEQIEDGLVDHNVIAVPVDAGHALTDADQERLRQFVLHVFDHISGKEIRVGRFLDTAAAMSHIQATLETHQAI